jgi:hypothetical protein
MEYSYNGQCELALSGLALSGVEESKSPAINR